MAEYPVEIASLTELHPALEVHAAAVPTLALTRAVGTQISPSHIFEASHASLGLQVRGPGEVITREAISDAASGVTVVALLHGLNAFCGGHASALTAAILPNADQLVARSAQDQQASVRARATAAQYAQTAREAEAELGRTRPATETHFYAQLYNAASRDLNAVSIDSAAQLRALAKTQVGSGHDRVRGLLPPDVDLPGVVDAPIGARAPILVNITRPRVLELSDYDILSLVEFYNDDLGLRPGESLQVWVTKVLHWMTHG